VNICLLALLGAPDYHVVVGRLTPEMEERLRGTPSVDPNPANRYVTGSPGA
jgi:hypothetical protein